MSPATSEIMQQRQPFCGCLTMTIEPAGPATTTDQSYPLTGRSGSAPASSAANSTPHLPGVTANRQNKLRPERRMAGKQLSLIQLEKVCHRLGRSVKAGISLLQAWDNETRYLTGPLKRSFERVRSRIVAGETAADAIADDACFPSMFVEMVRVGEETGQLDRAFLRLADHYRNLVQLRRTFVQGLTWPMMQLMTAVGIITLLFLIVAWLESSLAMFKAPDIFWLGLSPIGNLVLFWGFVLSTIAGIYLAIQGTARGWFGRLPMQIALHIPLLGNTIQTMSLSRFAWSFGTAVDSGMDAQPAIRLGIRSTQNHYYTSHENGIAESVQRGDEFYTALDRTGAFPEDLLQTVQVGEVTGELGECLERLSDDYRDQAENSLRRISQMTGFGIFILVASIIGIAIMLMYANYLSTMHKALTNPIGTTEQIESGEKTKNPVTAAKNRAVKDFVEQNEDFQQIKSMYEHLQNINKMTPDEFLDGF